MKGLHLFSFLRYRQTALKNKQYMRKIFTLAFMLMLSAASLSAQNLFHTEFASEDEFKVWTQLDVNGDGSTWTFNNDATPSKVYYNYNGNNQADDWLISPEITPEESGTVMVEYSFYGSSYKEAMEVYYGSGRTAEAMTHLAESYPEIPGSTQTGYFLINVKAGESFNIGFRATTPADRWRLYLLSVNVRMVSNPVDIKVSEIITPETGEGLGDETVKVKIENKGFVDLSSFYVGFDVDGNTIAKEPVSTPLAKGKTIEYTFNTKADLSIPRHNYTIAAYTLHPDDIAISNDTVKKNVRHVAPATVPYKMGFEPTEDDLSGIKIFNLNNDSGDWGLETASFFMNLARTGVGCLGYNYDKENAADDWVILDPITVEPGYYVLKFWYSGDDNHPEKLGVYWGNEATPSAMTNKIVEYAPFARGAYEESISILHFDKPQTVCVGFYAFSDKDENWICIDDVSFDKIGEESVDLLVSEISNPFDFHRAQNKQDVTFEIRNVGIKNAQAKVKVKLDDTLIKESEIEVKAQEFKKVTFEGLMSGIAAGEHNLAVEVECADDNNADNNTLAKTVIVLGTPVCFWDFEEGKVPSNLSFRTEDTGTVNPDAGDEFNEYGWGIFSIQPHYMLGENVLAGTSWIDGVDNADRWLILPKVKVTGENSYFVWDANSFNQYFFETYQVKVSDGEDSYYNYTTAKEVTLESITPKTRGISLTKYAGKEVYVAIRLMTDTKKGEALILDNIGLYGDVTSETTGIGTVMSDDARGFVISGGCLTVAGNDVQSISVSDTKGCTVASASGNTVALSSLPAGVYIAVAKTSTGLVTYKFVRR